MSKSVSYVIQDPILSDVKVTNLTRSDLDGSIQAVAHYALRDAGGTVVLRNNVLVQLSAGQITQFNTFLTNNILPAIISKEGL